MTGVTVSVICISYNCAEPLRLALTSLAAQEVPGGMEIIVVDNASGDASAEVARSFPGVKVVSLANNAGFAAANNVGIREAAGTRFLFANPDVEAPPGVAAALSKFMAARPQAAAVGPTVAGPDGAVQRFCARRFPTIFNLVLQVAGWGETRWAASRWLHRFEAPDFYTSPPAQTDALAGAFMMVRRNAFMDVGGFDEGYFLYGEDVDLCRRFKEAGGEVWYVPGPPVRHYTGGSRGSANSLVIAASHVAAERYARKWRGGPAGALVAAVSALSLATRRGALGAVGVISARARAAGRVYAEALRLKRRLRVGR